MEQLFTTLSRAIEGSFGLASSAAFAWGVLSILLSPCHLAGIPLIVGFINQRGRMTTQRAFTISLLFSVGILVTIGVIGGLTAALGRMLGDIGRWGNYGAAILFFAIGLHLLDAVRLPLPGAAQPGIQRKGLRSAFFLGLVFGVALGPCTFAFMAPMLAVSFRLAASNLPYGMLLLLLYGAGHCGVIVLAGTFTEVIQRYLTWNEKSSSALILKRACGLLVLLGGLYLVYTAP